MFRKRQSFSLLFISMLMLLFACSNEDDNQSEGNSKNSNEKEVDGSNASDNSGNNEKVGTSSIYWPDEQQLPRFAEPEHLDAVDVLDEPGDIKLMFATLQGIVNRERPRIYLLEDREEGKYTWLDDLDVPYEVYEDYMGLIEKYSHDINGMIIYDPEISDSINVATTMAGVEDAIVVSPDLSEQLSEDPYEIETIEDLRGKFTDKMDAYEWQLENLWEKTTDRMIVGLSPGNPVDVSGELSRLFEVIAKESTRENEANNREEYNIDLSEYLSKDDVYLLFEDAYPDDGWGPAVHKISVEADDEVIAEFKAGTSEEESYLYDRQHSQVADGQGGHRFADHDSYFVYKFTPPEGTEELTVSIDMWNQYKVSVSNENPPTSEQVEPFGYLRDYAVANEAMVFWLAPHEEKERHVFDNILSEIEPGTPYLGWFADDVKGEFGGVEYVSEHGVYVVPADVFSNLTVFSGTEMEPVQQKSEPTPTLENKIYVTLIFGEGDNFQYNQHHMRNMWEDENRGQVPVNWTSSPLLYDGAPAILDYYQSTATENDLLVTGPSGVGYFYADPWPTDHFSTFLDETYSYMEKTDMTIPYVLNRVDEENIPLSEEKAKAYEEYYNASGLFLSWEDNIDVSVSNDTLPISTIRGVGSVAEGREVLEEAKENWDKESPTFVSIGLLAWNLSPTEVVKMTESLGSEYEIVLADEYISLIRQAYQLDD